MKVYISGKITGDDNYKEKFRKAEEMLKTRGDDVINPAGKDGLQGDNHTWEDYMRHDIGLLVQCDSIYLLPDWEESQGALLEFYVAAKLGLFIEFEIQPSDEIVLHCH